MPPVDRCGFDPDEWFDSVESLTPGKIGIETTTYVRNIFKRCTSYKLSLELMEERKKARE